MALTSHGSLDEAFGHGGVIATALPPGAEDLTMARTDGGELLVGGSATPDESTTCMIFHIREYQPTGAPAREFRPIVGYGDGAKSTSCREGNAQIPQFDSAKLTSIVTLPSGGFIAVGVGSGTDPTQSGGFMCWHEADGALDADVGSNESGVMTFPGGPDLNEQIEAVAEPDSGFVAAMSNSHGVSLRPIAPSGSVGRVLTVNSPGQAADIAVADAGSGKILIVSSASGIWHIARYRYISP
jgi:hypothetical protein